MSRQSAESVFDPKVVAGIVAAGIAAFAAFLFLFAHAGPLDLGTRGRPSPDDRSAVGYQGLVRLIQLQGGRTRLIDKPWELDGEELVVATLTPRTEPDAIARLLMQRQTRATLLVLPKWEVVPADDRAGWVQAIGLALQPRIRDPLVRLGDYKVVPARGGGRLVGRGLAEGIVVPAPRLLQTVQGKDLRPLLQGPGGETVLAEVGDGLLFLLADPDLLNNKGIKDPRTARAALALLDSLNTTGARSIGFDLTVNGVPEPPGLLKLAFQPPFLALTLALFVAALLAGLHGAFRFGPAADDARAVPLGKAALVENSAGLFRLARREPAVGGAYAELVGEAAAQETGAAAALQGEALQAYLDRLSPPETRFSALAERVRAARDRYALLDAARALSSWKKELIK